MGGRTVIKLLGAMACVAVAILGPVSFDRYKAEVYKTGGTVPMPAGMAVYACAAVLLGVGFHLARSAMKDSSEGDRDAS